MLLEIATNKTAAQQPLEPDAGDSAIEKGLRSPRLVLIPKSNLVPPGAG
jgi:hypothetical protein